VFLLDALVVSILSLPASLTNVAKESASISRMMCARWIWTVYNAAIGTCLARYLDVRNYTGEPNARMRYLDGMALHKYGVPRTTIVVQGLDSSRGLRSGTLLDTSAGGGWRIAHS